MTAFSLLLFRSRKRQPIGTTSRAQKWARFVAEVEAAVDEICARPDQQLRWNKRYCFRMLDKFPYYVVFRQVRGEAVIVAVRHTSQDDGAWQKR